jgi:hypothetical protein
MLNHFKNRICGIIVSVLASCVDCWCKSRSGQSNIELDFYNARALKQQSVCRHIVPLGHIFPIPSQSVFVLTPLWRVLNVKATYIALTRPDSTKGVGTETWENYKYEYISKHNVKSF